MSAEPDSDDITELIMHDHEWFRRRFAELDGIRAGSAGTEELAAVWEPLGARLDVHAIAEEKIFYPQLLRKGDNAEDETLDAIGDHNEIRDGVRDASRAPIGSPGWWDAVDRTRDANDEHMAEEERDGLADFRRHASPQLRQELGRRFVSFLAAHPTATGLDTEDKDPEEYVEDIEQRIESQGGTGRGRSASAAGDRKGTPDMDHLMRRLAPIPAAAWTDIDAEAKQRLATLLAARRVLGRAGENDWTRSASDLGRTTALDGPPPGIEPAGERIRLRRVLPLTEIRIPFGLERAELDNADRGAQDLDLDPLGKAAWRAAEIENRAVFHGWPAAGIPGIIADSPHPPTPLGEDTNSYPTVVARAVDTLRRAGIEGPYALVIGPTGYTRIVEATEHGGYPLLDHIASILGGEVIWCPGLDDAVVLSRRGGDFHLDIGQDHVVGYSHHDADTVTLYLEETFTFRTVAPDAAVALTTVPVR